MITTPAYAQSPEGGGFSSSIIMLVLIFGIIYFLMIRPQQKKMKSHQAMLAAIKRGDQVVTGGGIIGKVTRVKDDEELEVEIAQGAKIRVVRSTISSVIAKTDTSDKSS